MKIKELLARIKWKPVIGVLVVVALLAIALWAASSFKPFSSGYKGEGDIQARAWADPSRVDLNGKGKVSVDVRNTGDESVKVVVDLAAYSDRLTFPDSGTQTINRTDSIGPRESRQYDFNVAFNAADAGKYGLLVKVSPGDIENEVFFEVAKK